ncbi:PIN domain nuclease [Candidatus Sumerlaeota bacterium]|nr:PIN domain nuclease [Candidatus Sumerlaeota bacterium]
MILVDTSVWIDFFAGRNAAHVERLAAFLSEGKDICICGIVLAEVLQGIRSDQEHRRTKKYFESLVYLPMTRDTFLRSAALYRSLRKRGATIRKPLDCMIASVAIGHGVQLLHNDRDFDAIGNYAKLSTA